MKTTNKGSSRTGTQGEILLDIIRKTKRFGLKHPYQGLPFLDFSR